MKAGRLAAIEALATCPETYRWFRRWRAELEAGASPYRLRVIGDGADLDQDSQDEESHEGEGAGGRHPLERLYEQHCSDAVAAIDSMLAWETPSVGQEITGRSGAGRAIADYGLHGGQFKELTEALLVEGRNLASIDMAAARVAREVGYVLDEFSGLWLTYSPMWGSARAAAPFEGRVEFAAVLSKVADFAKRTGMSVPSFRRAIALARSALAMIEDAKHEMFTANMRLVISMANQLKYLGVPFDDLIQEGNIGLLRAIDGYDHSLGYRFASYASWWIQQSMMRAIADQSRTIRYPVGLVDKMSKVRITTLVFQQRNGRRPTEQEIIEITGLKPWIVKRCLEAATTLSLDTRIGDDDTTLADLIEDVEATHPDEPLLHDDVRRQLSDLLATLPHREEHILRRRFGIDGEERTFEELGRELCLSKERIRQLEVKALKVLKLRAGARGLRVLLG